MGTVFPCPPSFFAPIGVPTPAASQERPHKSGLTKNRPRTIPIWPGYITLTANPNIVRVQPRTGHSQKRPHKKSAANLKHCRRFRIGHREPERGEGSCPDSKHWPTVKMLSPDLNEVRVQAGIQSFFTWLEALDPGLRRGDDPLQHVKTLLTMHHSASSFYRIREDGVHAAIIGQAASTRQGTYRCIGVPRWSRLVFFVKRFTFAP